MKQVAMSLCSTPLSSCVEQFFVDKLFIGTDGITPNYSFTNDDMMRAEAVKAMSQHADKTIILTESQKFSAHGVVPVIGAKDVYAVYTDESIPQKVEEGLLERHVMIHKTPASQSSTQKTSAPKK